MTVLDFITENTNDYWNELDNFVRITMDTRDSSHGYLHMKNVAINSIKILSELDKDILSYNNIKIVLFSAWLHDICDHKYDPTRESKSY